MAARQCKRHAYTILNPAGDFWSPLTFASERLAREHLDDFARTVLFSTAGFTFPRVRVRLTLAPKPSPDEEAEL